MFAFAILTIVYSYSIFALGLLHLIYKESLIVVAVLYIASVVLIIRNSVWALHVNKVVKQKLPILIVLLLTLLVVVNFIGVLGPETSFDALWYHLTFPKLYLLEHNIRYIPGGLLYYSTMPKLGELLFTPTLAFGNEVFAKGIQFFFGILTVIVIYKLSRKYFSLTISLLACLIFYSNIVVAWESTVAYIDLIRVFFEILALYAFLLWYEKKQNKWFLLSAIMLGGAIATKILAIGSLFIFVILILFINWKKKAGIITSIAQIRLFGVISLFAVSPWLLFSYFTTGNPFYPFFTSIYKTQVAESIFSFQRFLQDFIQLFLFSDDPISPIYLIVLPLIILYFKRLSFPVKIIGLYVGVSLLIWYITPRTGGGRFSLPYLPALSLLTVSILEICKKQKYLYNSIVICILFLSLVTIGYRGIANARYIPVIVGKESKDHYLTNHLNFSFGDFYDIDEYFKTHIKPTDKVLLYGFHNLYYVNFPFVDSSWVQKGDTFTHIATQHTTLPERFKDWKAIYKNPKTSVTLYKSGEKSWKY